MLKINSWQRKYRAVCAENSYSDKALQRMIRFSACLALTILLTACVSGRDVGRFVESTIIRVPQNIAPVGSPSRGAQFIKVYPSGEYAISRDRHYIAMDGFNDLRVIYEHSEWGTDYIFLAGATTDGHQKTLLFVSPSSVKDSGFFELPGSSSRPIEVQKEGSRLRFIQENSAGTAYVVAAVDRGDYKTIGTATVPKSAVAVAPSPLAAPAAAPYFDKPAAPKGATTTKPSAPSTAPASKSAYGISLPPLDAYTSVKVDQAGKAKVETTSAPESSSEKPRLVLD